MFGLTDPSKRPNKKKKARRHLEFDFLGEPESEEVDSQKKSIASKKQVRVVPTEPVNTAQTRSAAESTINQQVTAAGTTPDEPTESSSKPENKSMPETIDHRPIRTSESIRRQKREQKAMNSLLSGVGLAFTCGILVVGALASLGGYVLYKQLKDQSATISLMEQNTKQRFFEMETDLIRRDTELAKNLEQTNLRLMKVNTSFEEYRHETTRTLAQLRATNKALEKQLTEARQDNLRQGMQLARLESSVRIRR